MQWATIPAERHTKINVEKRFLFFYQSYMPFRWKIWPSSIILWKSLSMVNHMGFSPERDEVFGFETDFLQISPHLLTICVLRPESGTEIQHWFERYISPQNHNYLSVHRPGLFWSRWTIVSRHKNAASIHTWNGCGPHRSQKPKSPSSVLSQDRHKVTLLA